MTDQHLKTPQEKRIFWQQHIDQWKQSGFSQSEYRRRNHLDKARWGYWKKRLTATNSQIAELVPIAIPSRDANCLRVIVDDRLAIEVPVGFDPGTLSKVVACLTHR